MFDFIWFPYGLTITVDSYGFTESFKASLFGEWLLFSFSKAWIHFFWISFVSWMNMDVCGEYFNFYVITRFCRCRNLLSPMRHLYMDSNFRDAQYFQTDKTIIAAVKKIIIILTSIVRRIYFHTGKVSIISVTSYNFPDCRWICVVSPCCEYNSHVIDHLICCFSNWSSSHRSSVTC